MRIRPYDDSIDRDAVIGLVRELQATEKRIFDKTKPPEEIGHWYVDYMLSQIKDGRGRIFIAEEDGIPAGYALVRHMRSTDDSVLDEFFEYASIVDLCVTEGRRGNGLGRALIDACETHARDKEIDILRIGVLADNHPARVLYEESGFRPLSIEMEKALRR